MAKIVQSLPRASKEYQEDVAQLSNLYSKYVNKYRKDCAIHSTQWPQQYSFEQIRLKRYLPDGTDQFGSHVDVNDHNSARRFLVFFLYLDDNEKGSTSFPQHRIMSECQKGSCLIFPPMWPWLHAGEKPINKPKYIVGSYLHYV